MKAFSFVEILVLIVLVAVVLIPLLNLSRSNMEDPAEIMERSVAQTLCLDMLERFNRYKTYWSLPGATVQGTLVAPSEEMYGPLDLKSGRGNLFDNVYLEQLKTFKMPAVPTIERDPVPDRPGLFKLTVTLSWKSRQNFSRSVRYSRYCYAP